MAVDAFLQTAGMPPQSWAVMWTLEDAQALIAMSATRIWDLTLTLSQPLTYMHMA